MTDFTELTGGIVKRAAHLADGRELFYFDDPDTTLGTERAVDARVLDPRPETATMRQDVLTGEWISIAAARGASSSAANASTLERSMSALSPRSKFNAGGRFTRLADTVRFLFSLPQ